MGSVTKLGVGKWLPGLGFRPEDDELIYYHLRRKICGLQESCTLIPELDIYQWDPQSLFDKYDEMSDLTSDGRFCWFFSTLNTMNNKNRKKRKTPGGFWKGTGKEHTVRGWDEEEIGYKKIFVFHEGRQPGGKVSPFSMHSMHEYHLNCCSVPTTGADQSQAKELVLCRIINRMFKKTGPDSPSPECVMVPDPVTPGPSNIANEGDYQASTQSQVCNPLNLTEGEVEMPRSDQNDVEEMNELLPLWYKSCLVNEHHQQFSYNNDQFCVGGSCFTNVNYSDFGREDDDGLSFSDLWG